MKLLWLCNMMPGKVRERASGKPGSGLWVDHVLSDLRRKELRIHILCPGENQRGSLDGKCGFATFRDREPYR